jgi:predicted GIY-YIG superfamily endonuclease
MPEPTPRRSSIAVNRRGCAVYLAYDRTDTLLYVGISSDPSVRMAGHQARSEWWPLAYRIDTEQYDTRSEALAREAALIRQRRPPFNTQHNPEPRRAPRECVYAAYGCGNLASCTGYCDECWTDGFADLHPGNPDVRVAWKLMRRATNGRIRELPEDFDEQVALYLKRRPALR